MGDEDASDGHCFHSMMMPDCAACWRGFAHRQSDYIERLRQILVNAGAGTILALHDRYWFGGNAPSLPDDDG